MAEKKRPRTTRPFSELEDRARREHPGWDDDVAAIKDEVERARSDTEFTDRLKRRHEDERDLYDGLSKT